MVARTFSLLWLFVLCACASTALPPMPEQPALARAIQPYADQFRSLGITRVSSPGGGAMLRLETGYGDVYVRYPVGVQPMTFVMDIDATASQVHSDTLDQAQFRQLFAAFAPEAIQVTISNNEFGWARANPWR